MNVYANNKYWTAKVSPQITIIKLDIRMQTKPNMENIQIIHTKITELINIADKHKWIAIG